jgi:hypothetical protein
MSENKALLVSFYFPPNNSMAAVRIGKFAKYLPEFGWEPFILTVNKAAGPLNVLPIEIEEDKITKTRYFSIRDLLIRKINNHNPNINSQDNEGNFGSLLTKSIRLWEPLIQLPVIEKLIFDPMGWYQPAVKAGLEIIKSHDIKVIFSSYGPSVSHFIAARLHRETGIPWVADYRDDWIDEYRRHTQPFHFFDQQWEKYTVKNCNAIVSHTEALAKILEKSHHKVPFVIPNGFDQDDFGIEVPLTRKFTLTYTGYIYAGKRDPSPVFEALAEAKKERKITPQEIEIRFFGHNTKELISPLIKKYNIDEFVTLGGSIPYKESIKRQKESTALLLLSWNDPKDIGTVSGKTYEYMGSDRPILALAYPNGEIDKLLSKTGCGIVANNPGEIKQLLLVWLAEFKRNGIIESCYHPQKKTIDSYTRKEQTQALADVFNKMTI